MKIKLIIGFLILTFLLSCGGKEKEQENIIVQVGDSKLTWSMLEKEIPQELKGKISREQVNTYIQQWIDQEILYQAAVRMGMDLDEDYFRELEKMKKEILVRKFLENFLLTKDAQVTEQEMLDFYEKNKDTFIIAKTEIHAQHILVPTREMADLVMKKIRSGEDFEKVAHEMSVDFQQRGRVDLGYFTKDDLLPELASKVFSYRVGSVTRPLKSDFGYHIFKILDRRERGTFRTFDEVKNKIYERLRASKKKMAYRKLVSDLKEKIIVKKNDTFLSEMYQTAAQADSMP